MDVLSQYQDVVESVLGAIHPDAAGRANSAKLGYDVVALEVNLANASPEREDMDDVTVRFPAFLHQRGGAVPSSLSIPDPTPCQPSATHSRLPTQPGQH